MTKQYFYKVVGCIAKSSKDPSCLCWHDAGTGPVFTSADLDPKHITSWREKPVTEKPRITYDSTIELYTCALTGKNGWIFSGYGETPFEAYAAFMSQYGINLA